jgi:hypothetical protein
MSRGKSKIYHSFSLKKKKKKDASKVVEGDTRVVPLGNKYFE